MRKHISALLVLALMLGYLGSFPLPVFADETTPTETGATVDTNATEGTETTVPALDVAPNSENSGSCGDALTWTLDGEGTLTISGTGEMAAYGMAPGEGAPWIGPDVKKVVISDGVTSVGTLAFWDCGALESVTFGKDVASIGGGAFMECAGLTQIALPAALAELGGQVFSQCEKLEQITVDAENPNFSSQDGVLFNKDMTELLVYPAGKTGEHAAMPETVTAIGGYAFEACGELTGITVPLSVKSLGDEAITGCGKLEYVQFLGSPKQWKTVNMSDSLRALLEPLMVYEGVDPAMSATAQASPATGKPVITWTVSDGAAKYEIYRATSATGKYTRVKSLTTGTSYTDTGAAVGTRYYYEVRAMKGTTVLEKAAADALCVCAQPKVKVSVSTATGQPTLSWGKVTGAAKYEILRAEAADGAYTSLAVQKGTSFTDKTASADTVYYYKVKVIATKAGADSLDMAPVEVITKLAKPTITAFVSNGGFPGIRWEEVPGATSYKIYRATSAKGAYALAGTTTGEEYIDETASIAKIYYYKVTACGVNSESAMSDYKSVRACIGTTELTAQRDTASGKAKLQWLPVTNALKYEVHRATSATGKYTRVTTTEDVTYLDTKATPGNTYYYKVYAVPASTAAKSLASNVESVFALCAQPNVKVSHSKTGQHTLSWGKVTGAAKYQVLRADSADGAYTVLATQKGTSYTDKATTPDTLYYYKVNAIATKAGADSLDMTPLAVARATPKPVLDKAGNVDSGKPQLLWKVAEDARSYNIYRATASKGAYTLVGNDADGDFVDTTAEVGKRYYYKITALGDESESAMSDYKSVYCLADIPVVTVCRPDDSGKPQLDWAAVEGAVKYEIWRATRENGKYTKIATTASLTYLDSKATPGTTYYYKAHAVPTAAAGKGKASQVVSMFAICAQPTVKVTLSNKGQHTLSWGKVTGAAKYEILRSETPEGVFTLLTTQTGTSYTDKATTPDTLYYYKVNAIASKTGADSVDAIPVAAARSLAQPKITKITTDPVSGKPVITWTAVDGAVSYTVWRADSAKGEYVPICVVPGTTLEEIAAQTNKVYYYKVTADGHNSQSLKSDYKSIRCKCAAPNTRIAVNGPLSEITWDAVDGAVKYEVYRATKETGKYTKIKTTEGLKFSAVTVGTYYYKVKAIGANAAANSAFGQIVTNAR